MKTATFTWRDWANNAATRDSVPMGEPAIVTHEGAPRYLVIRLAPPRSVSAQELRQRSLAAGLKRGRKPALNITAEIAASRRRP